MAAANISSDFGARENKVCHCLHCFSTYWSPSPEVMGLGFMIFIYWMLSLKPAFSVSSFTFIKRFFSSSSLYVLRVVSSAYLRLLIFLPAILIPVSASSSRAFSLNTKYSAFNSLDLLSHTAIKPSNSQNFPGHRFPLWPFSLITASHQSAHYL